MIVRAGACMALLLPVLGLYGESWHTLVLEVTFPSFQAPPPLSAFSPLLPSAAIKTTEGQEGRRRRDHQKSLCLPSFPLGPSIDFEPLPPSPSPSSVQNLLSLTSSPHHAAAALGIKTSASSPNGNVMDASYRPRSSRSRRLRVVEGGCSGGRYMLSRSEQLGGERAMHGEEWNELGPRSVEERRRGCSDAGKMMLRRYAW